MKYKYLLLLICLLIAAGNIQAQKTTQKDRHYFDLAFGGEINMKSTNKDNMTNYLLNNRYNSSFVFSMQYQYFFSKNWGAFVDMQYTNVSSVSYNDLPQMMKPDEEKFYINPRYSGGYNDFDDDYGDTKQTYQIGIKYRLDSKHWSFRPYVGAGVAIYPQYSYDFMLKGIGNNEVYESTLKLDGKNSATFCVTPGIYLAWKITSGFHLFADVSYNHHTRTFKSTYRTTDAYTGKVVDEKSDKSIGSRPLNIKIGMSFPLWLNKRN